jgi:hypothetical protein
MSKPKAGEEVFVRSIITGADDGDEIEVCDRDGDYPRFIRSEDVLPASALAAPQPDKVREALQYLVDELKHYANKHGLGPARLMHALVKAEAALGKEREL